MKYIAVLDTDEIEDFAFFEDGKEKYLHGIDANSVNGEWIYLPFKPLEQEPILDKVKQAREEIDEMSRYTSVTGVIQYFEMCADCIEKYLTDDGKRKLECLLVAVRNAVEIEETEPQESEGKE